MMQVLRGLTQNEGRRRDDGIAVHEGTWDDRYAMA